MFQYPTMVHHLPSLLLNHLLFYDFLLYLLTLLMVPFSDWFTFRFLASWPSLLSSFHFSQSYELNVYNWVLTTLNVTSVPFSLTQYRKYYGPKITWFHISFPITNSNGCSNPHHLFHEVFFYMVNYQETCILPLHVSSFSTVPISLLR